VTYLLSASGLSTTASDLQTGLFLAVALLVLRTAQETRRRATLVVTAALIGSVAATVLALTRTQTGQGAADLWKGLILLLTSVLIVRRVLAKPTVTMQSIYGALSAYLIVGLMFAAFYAAMQRLGHGPFFVAHEPASTQTYQYFSFTTLTTLGYGDFTAASNAGRALAVIEALTGQVFLATLVARLVTAFRNPAGPVGPAGPPGPAGAVGPAAATGDPGEAAQADGAIKASGASGAIDVSGATGVTGATGAGQAHPGRRRWPPAKAATGPRISYRRRGPAE
jgi:hypothetical protein